MGQTKLNLDRQAEGRVLALGTTSANGEALLTLNKGTAADTTVVLDAKGSITIAGDINLTGVLNIADTGGINNVTTTNTNINDINITLNNGGSTASAAGAGLLIEGDSAAVIAKLIYDSTLTSKWKIGDGTTQAEVVTVSGAQTLTNKTIGGGQISGNITGNAANVTGTVAVGNGGTGATTLTGYVKGTGTTAMTASATIPGSDISGNITGNAANVTGTVAIANGGTGQTTKAAAYNALTPITTLGDLVYGDAANSATRLGGNTTSTKMFLSQTGTGTISAVPVWTAVAKADIGLANVENTALSTWTGSANITTLGTIGSGTWQGTAVAGQYGGTGVNNSGKTITLGGNLTTSGAFATTLTVTAATNVTLPTTGTLATLAGSESLTNKNLNSGTNTFPTFNQNTTGTAANVTGTVAVANGGTGLTTLTTGNVILGAGTSTPTFVAPGTSGNVLTSNGSTWVSSAPTGTAAYGHWTTVSGTQDGSNKVFTIGNSLSSGSEIVVFNGAVWDSGASNDYVLSGTTLTIQAGQAAPTSTDKIKVYGTY